jgi:hypothetical protein
VAGAALGLASVPAAAQGTHDLIGKAEDKPKSFLAQGVVGSKEAWKQRNATVKEHAPAHLVAGNYLAGAGIGSAVGGLTHLALGRTRIGGGLRSAIAASGGLATGTAALPVQSRITRRASHGKYEVTPYGVRRAKTPPVRPSRKATVVDQKRGQAAFRAQTVGKADPGANLTRAQRRAAVTAAGVPIPVVGDIAQAATAARLSPEKYRRRTAVQNFAGSQAGGLAGNAAGAGAALALASRHKGFERGATQLNETIERHKTNIKARVGIKPSTAPGLMHHVKARVPARIMTSGPARALARRPGVAAVGALVGGAVGGQAAQQATYGHIMRRDDRYRAAQSHNAHGSRIAKAAPGTGMSRREEIEQIRRKQHAAVANLGAGGLGVSSLGMIGAAALPKVPGRVRAHLVRAGTVTGTVGAGVGGVTGLRSTRLQQRDLRARRHALEGGVAKALRPTGARTPSVRRGFIRARRLASGLTSTSTVRGGLA